MWDDYKIKPVIDIRKMWREEGTKQLMDYENVVYDNSGKVYRYCLGTGKRREMANGGFEEKRGTLKKIRPAKQYGIEYKHKDKCPVKQGIRIPMNTNRRIFTPIDRSSYKWGKY